MRHTGRVRSTRDSWLAAAPWAIALLGLAVPMIGSGFIGWPFAVGWLVLLLLLWWIRPLADADRTTRLAAGVGAAVALALLSTFGGFYLLPAVIIWLIAGWRNDSSPQPDG